jgi:hypothetical protein
MIRRLRRLLTMIPMRAIFIPTQRIAAEALPIPSGDDTGGGGTPNTIWEENFGGSGPKTRPAATFVTDMLVGSGLRAQFAQIGPGTIIY